MHMRSCRVRCLRCMLTARRRRRGVRPSSASFTAMSARLMSSPPRGTPMGPHKSTTSVPTTVLVTPPLPMWQRGRLALANSCAAAVFRAVIFCTFFSSILQPPLAHCCPFLQSDGGWQIGQQRSGAYRHSRHPGGSAPRPQPSRCASQACRSRHDEHCSRPPCGGPANAQSPHERSVAATCASAQAAQHDHRGAFTRTVSSPQM